MNAPGQTTGEPVSARRRYAALCCLVMLHLAVLGVGLFAWPDMIFQDASAWNVPFVMGDLAAVVSLAVIWLVIDALSLGTRMTIVFVTLVLIWLTVALLLRGLLGFGGPVFVVVVAMLLSAMYWIQGLLMTLVFVWLCRRRRWVMSRRGAAAEFNGSNVGQQFGLRHIMLWTLLAAVVLAALRATIGKDGGIAELLEVNDLFAALLVYLGLGVIHAGVGVASSICLVFQLRWWSAMLAVASAVVLTALSAGWIVAWAGWNDNEVWPISLITVVHFILFSASIGLLRLAGYRFTRRADTPAEATTT